MLECTYRDRTRLRWNASRLGFDPTTTLHRTAWRVVLGLRQRIHEDDEAQHMAEHDAGSPNSDSPGNAAWREAKRQLAMVQAREQTRGR